MCLFPLPNYAVHSAAYKKGLVEFECGACPECLKKRARVWALRSVFQARESADNCMITLTYDSFRYADRRFNLENPVNTDLHVSKRHIQLFIKRLRKAFPDRRIKYLCTAEYGSRTGRAHYHLLLFNVKFPDLVYYKQSGRGHRIYTSALLTRLWGYGICTVDSISVNGSTAAYCTKYLAKTRGVSDTFMLFSHNIGVSEMLREFNGIGYYLDGVLYPVPKKIWSLYLQNKYSELSLDNRYVNFTLQNYFFGTYQQSCLNRSVYRAVRDSDPEYCNYLEYWRVRGEEYQKILPPVAQRLYSLPDSKYFFYKARAFDVYRKRKSFHIPVPAPDSKCVSALYHYRSENGYSFTSPIVNRELYDKELRSCPCSSCQARANDTKVKYLEHYTVRVKGRKARKTEFLVLREYLSDEIINFDKQLKI
ncbi:replication initiator protein [Dipodfec virus UOA04_Rod_781]|nr:replication initiator protein [Dipodfec virus UOA04_Rod_781]